MELKYLLAPPSLLQKLNIHRKIARTKFRPHVRVQCIDGGLVCNILVEARPNFCRALLGTISKALSTQVLPRLGAAPARPACEVVNSVSEPGFKGPFDKRPSRKCTVVRGLVSEQA